MRFSNHCKDLTAHEALAVRMAFLVSRYLLSIILSRPHTTQRAVYTEDPSSRFWTTVDEKLEEVRNKCAQRDAISFTEKVLLPSAENHATNSNNRALNQIYNQDLTTYPPEDESPHLQAHPTAAQSEINRHIHSRS